MSLAMHRTSLASPTGAMKPSRIFGSSSVGTSLSSTYGSSTRIPKQAHSSSYRRLHPGPGPLPHFSHQKSYGTDSTTTWRKTSNDSGYASSGRNSYTHEDLKSGPLPNKPHILDKSGTHTREINYVAASRVTPAGHFSHQKSYGTDSTTTRRKTSNDCGYASSSGNSYTYGDLRSGKMKSLSQLNSQWNKASDLSRSPPNRSRMESSMDGVSSRTGHSYTQNHVGTKATLNGGSNTKSSSRGIYRSTTRLDYKDPKEDRKSLHNGRQSHSSHLIPHSLSNADTISGKENYSVRDADKTRKATMTALPGSDMKCAGNSSFNSSNSSPSNSMTMDGKYVEDLLEPLKSSFQEILITQPKGKLNVSTEGLYGNAYSLVLHKHGEMLYSGLQEVVTGHLVEKVYHDVMLSHDDDFLDTLNTAWSRYQESMKNISVILSYM
ncbi:uncharacterized protein LOC110065457, partial [Orbicella faveolata]|uniref:uncharacterized protein LOC110065457 n=1 Tax=Orbicella faveolata TaxID=48498 RepID=UPI0009E5AAC2